MNVLLLSYGIYLALSLVLTVWVAQTLHRNGRVFLVDVCAGNERLADSVNHLLRVGFYLVNLGYISLALKLDRAPASPAAALEAIAGKMGLVLLVLGAMHFFNLLMLNRWRRRAIQVPPPLPTHGVLTPAARA